MPRGISKNKNNENGSKKNTNSIDLMSEFEKVCKTKNLGSEIEYIPSYPTNIDIFDYRNGRIEFGELKLGISGGKILTIIGKSGTGKSTFATQIACNIVNDYDNAQVFHFDFERAASYSRAQVLSGWDDITVKKKYKILNKDIYSESFYKTVKALAELKLENFDIIKIDTGINDDNGNPIYMLPPSVVLVDSWALMTPKDITDEEELSGQMSATSIARVNNSIIKRLVDALIRANIILIVVNHITQKIEIGYTKTQAELNYLDQNESLPGGSSIVYLADSLIKLKSSTKLEKDKDLGIKGFQVIGKIVKSRSNESGNQFAMVFEQSKGFDNVLTNFIVLKELGLLKGNGRRYYFDCDPDTGFTQKTFKETYLENQEFRNLFNSYVKKVYNDFISGKLDDEDLKELTEISNTNEDDEGLSLVKRIKGDIWKCSDGNLYHYNKKTEEIIPIEDDEDIE